MQSACGIRGVLAGKEFPKLSSIPRSSSVVVSQSSVSGGHPDFYDVFCGYFLRKIEGSFHAKNYFANSLLQ